MNVRKIVDYVQLVTGIERADLVAMVKLNEYQLTAGGSSGSVTLEQLEFLAGLAGTPVGLLTTVGATAEEIDRLPLPRKIDLALEILEPIVRGHDVGAVLVASMGEPGAVNPPQRTASPMYVQGADGLARPLVPGARRPQPGEPAADTYVQGRVPRQSRFQADTVGQPAVEATFHIPAVASALVYAPGPPPGPPLGMDPESMLKAMEAPEDSVVFNEDPEDSSMTDESVPAREDD